MIGARLMRAARRRIDIVRGNETDGERGFALILVMLVSTMITIAVASVATVTAANIAPATHSQNNEAATAAAQSGIERYVAWLNANCGSFNSQACASITGDTPNLSGVVSGTVPGASGQGTASYKYQVLNGGSYLSDGFVRVRSTGKVGTATRTLTADVTGAPNILRFAYLTKYETLSSDSVNSYYPSRTVKVAGAFAPSADTASPALSSSSTNTVTWNDRERATRPDRKSATGSGTTMVRRRDAPH